MKTVLSTFAAFALFWSVTSAFASSPFDALLAQSLSEAQRIAVVDASEDFAAVLAFKKPVHAVPERFSISDEGSWAYKGKGYRITVWRQWADGEASVWIYGPDVRLDPKLFPFIHQPIAHLAFFESHDLIKRLGLEAEYLKELRNEEEANKSAQSPTPLVTPPSGQEAHQP
jgi:hypothetical protein